MAADLFPYCQGEYGEYVSDVYIGLYQFEVALVYTQHTSEVGVGIVAVSGIGRLMHLHSQADVFLVLSLTFKAGVPLLDCLMLAANASSWQHISRDLKNATLRLQQGQRLSQILTNMSWQPQALQLIRVGESAGDLALSFTQLQGYYEAQVIGQSQWLEQLLEPVLLIVVALFVGLILVALYLPLFQMGQMM